MSKLTDRDLRLRQQGGFKLVCLEGGGGGWISARIISVPTCNLLARRKLFLFALGFRKNWGYPHYKWRFQGYVNIHWPVGCWSSSNSSVKLSRNEHHLGAGPRDCNNANISMFYSHTQPCHFQARSHGLKIWPDTSFTRNQSMHCSHGRNEPGWTLTFVRGVTLANCKWCLPTKLPRIHACIIMYILRNTHQKVVL